MRTLFRDIRVFDGEKVLPSVSVLIHGGRISHVATEITESFDIEVDGRGRTLLPGLIDSHVHTFEGSLSQALAFGVTTELDMFSLPDNVIRQRGLAAARDDLADVRSAGLGATAPGGHPSQLMGEVFGSFATVSGPQDADAFVAQRVAEGCDYLKIIIEDGSGMGTTLPCLDLDTVRALVMAAHAAGLMAVAHVTSLHGARLALAAGADGLAHVFADSHGETVRQFAAEAAETGMFAISVLAMMESMSGSTAGHELSEDERIGPRLSAANRAAAGRPIPGFGTVPALRDNVLSTAGWLHRAGVRLLAGTDANDGPHGAFPVVHGASLHRELVLLTQAGLTPAEALAAATSGPADCFGLTDRGRIAPGSRADLLLVEGDPTTDITDTRSTVAVWRRGVHMEL